MRSVSTKLRMLLSIQNEVLHCLAQIKPSWTECWGSSKLLKSQYTRYLHTYTRYTCHGFCSFHWWQSWWSFFIYNTYNNVKTWFGLNNIFPSQSFGPSEMILGPENSEVISTQSSVSWCSCSPGRSRVQQWTKHCRFLKWIQNIMNSN